MAFSPVAGLELVSCTCRSFDGLKGSSFGSSSTGGACGLAW